LLLGLSNRIDNGEGRAGLARVKDHVLSRIAMWGLFPGTASQPSQSNKREQLLQFVTHPLAAEY
jgi:hypothetical protein